MNTELITRLKKNLETLAERMPEKFGSEPISGIGNCIFLRTYNNSPLIRYEDTYIFRDPLGEFSNSIGRIVWEAFGEYLEVVHDLKGMGDTTRSSKFFMAYLFKQKENNELDQSSFLSRLYEITELSAQVEALCLRIEAGL